ncbi:MAG: ADP-ribosylglycohydrolase family protein [Dysgonomonas sp.]
MNKKQKYKGALKLSAIGDALGWITEFESSKESLNSKYKSAYIDQFYDWEKIVGGRFNGYIDRIKAGSYSDDTQLLLCVARSIETNGDLNNEYFSKEELINWLYYSRGAGRTIKNAAQKLERKSAKWNSNFFKYKIGEKTIDYRESGANGAAMRILPIVLANYGNIEKIKKEVFANSIVTHGHPRAILGALLFAYSINQILSLSPEEFNPKEFIIQIGVDFIEKFNLPFLYEEYSFLNWVKEWDKGANISFQKVYENTLEETQNLLRLLYKNIDAQITNQDFLTQIGCTAKETKGSGILTVLAGLFFACRFSKSPIEGILEAVNYLGSDTDSIAAFTGSLLGALYGEKIIPNQWMNLQDFDYIDKISDKLYAISNKSQIDENFDNNGNEEIFNINVDKFKEGDIVYFNPLGKGEISKIERQQPITKGRYNLIIDVSFFIGQSCRFSKLISGSIPTILIENEFINLIKSRIQLEKQEVIIKKISALNNSNVNNLIKDILLHLKE